MKSIGIICEYNPFHNGHIYHINKIKEMFPDHIIILVMSGNFTQRGDVSLIDKWQKTEIALNYVDLVVELPFVFSVQSADVFAKGAVTILNELNVRYLVFGSESGDILELTEIAKTMSKRKYNVLVKDYMDNGLSYPSASAKAVYDLCGIKMSNPNDLLGISYIKETLKTTIKPVAIQRTNSFHDKDLKNKIASATAIRMGIKDKKNIKKFVPKETYKVLNNPKFTEDYFELLKYKIISTDIRQFFDVEEGIENRIKKFINECYDLDSLIKKVQCKRFTYARVKRILIHILCGLTKEEAKNNRCVKYIRVLGFNTKGRQYLKNNKKNNIPIITTYKSNLEMLQIENRVSLIYNNDLDYKHKPIIK